MKTIVGLERHIRFKHPEELPQQTVLNPPKVDLEAVAKTIKAVNSFAGDEVPVVPVEETDVDHATFTPTGPVEVMLDDPARVTRIGEPASDAEEGEKPLDATKPVLTKDILKGMLEEVLAEQKAEADRKALQDAVTAAASTSSEAKDLAGRACHGVECLQEAMGKIEGQLDKFNQLMEQAEEAEAPTVPVPQPIPQPVQPVQLVQPQPVALTQPPQRAEEHDHDHDHEHEHPAHLTSAEMAEGVLDRIMSCDQCSPAMKEALKRRLHRYLPDYPGFREEALGGEERREEEAQEELAEEGKPDPVAGGEEPGVSAEAKAEAEAGAGTAGDEPAGAGTSVGGSGNEAEAGPAEGAGGNDAHDAGNEPAAAPRSDDERKNFNDPLNWI